MEEVTADRENFQVVEWTIANFSCWNEDIHGEVIESQVVGGVLGVSLKLELRPKGLGENLLASIICDEPVFLLGVFSIIGPDGSILSTCEPDGSCDLLNLNLIGPRFEEVVALIRKNEALCEDQLTLKLRMRCTYDKVMLARTEIAMIRSSWRISCPTLENLSSGFNWISRTFYHKDDDSMGEMDLVALKGGSEIELRLDHESSFQKNVLVFVNVSVLGKDGAVLAAEDKERVFRERESWIFWNSSLTEEEFSLILQVKIVPSVKYKHQSGYYMPTFVASHCLVAPSYHQSQNY